MSIDLHLHTHYSDGNWSPSELVEAAIQLGFKTISITDHDTMAALPEARQAAGDRMEIISGIELNTKWVNPAAKVQDVHILGYFQDENSHDLQELILVQQKARLEQARRIVSNLQGQGHDISLDFVNQFVGKGPIGRPHIAQAMIKKGIVKGASEAYRALFDRDSDIYVVRDSIDPLRAIRAIRSAGGIPSLAHPGKEPFIPELLEELIPSGLLAIEAFHRGHTNSQARKYLKLAGSRHLLVTGGSDCHGPFEGYAASLGTIRLSREYLEQIRCSKFRALV